MTGVELFTIGQMAVTMGDVLTIGSALTGAMGAAQAGQAEASAAEYNAQAARMEASAEEARLRRESRRHIGAQRAGIAKAGVTTEGTPLLALAESAEMAELDALNVRYTGETGARLSEMRARSARQAIPYNVGASLLTGASNIGRATISRGV